MKRCVGCGVILQSEDNNKLGYIPANKINEAKYCERCFKLTHYNNQIIIPLKDVNDKIIKEVNKSKKNVYYIIDLLNINEETINTFKEIKTSKKMIVSKLDIIPRSIKTSKITEWLKNVYGINEDIFYISSNKDINLERIINDIERNQYYDSYILGYTNSGKSTLINNLCNKVNPINNKITTSLIPNTTLDFIKIKLIPEVTIIDSPGFTLSNTLYKDNELDLIKRINPKKFIKPVTYQTKDITSLLIEDRIRISFNSNNSVTTYFSNDLIVSKIFANNKKLLDQKVTTYNIDDNSDIVIKGIGFINVKKACKINVYGEYDNLIEIRKSMF